MQLLITADAPALINVALAANGGTASASSTSGTQAAANVINGDRKGLSSSWWTDNTSSSYPDSLEVNFGSARAISEIDVFGLQQNPGSPVEPTLELTSTYALTDFKVQYWTAGGWVDVPNGSVTGNNKVWRRFNFDSITTSKIQVKVTAVAGDNHSQVVELEAFGPTVPVNVALAANGASSSASSSFAGQPSANVNNGERKGLNYGWWTDNTSDGYPDWVEVDFAGAKTINEIDVIGLQEPWSSPVEPTLELTARYALTNFEVQYWTGSAWVAVPGGNITGNNKVWRKFNFDPLTTSKVRVYLTNVAGDNHTQVVELEAWTGASSSTANVNWLVTDQLGTPRMIFDKTGSLAATKRHDYLPFGEELSTGQGARTSALGYAPDTVRQKFTLKERDIETGLDYFGARYYGSTQGRFTSADPIQMTPDRLLDPQRINLYEYARNNPLFYVDPNGQDIISLGRSEDQINSDIDAINKKLKGKRLTAKQREKFTHQLDTLQQELEANKIVGQWLDALHSVGEGKDLKLSDLKVSTDARGDFLSMFGKQGYTKEEIEKAYGNTLFNPAIPAATLAGQIYVFTDRAIYKSAAAGGFELPGFGNVPLGDINIYGASMLGHERYHKYFGVAEPPAQKESLRILMRFNPDVIVNKKWIEAQKTFHAKQAGVPYPPPQK